MADTILIYDDFESYTIGAPVTGGWTQWDASNPATVKAPYWAHPTQYCETVDSAVASFLYLKKDIADGAAGFLARSEYGSTNIIARQRSSLWHLSECYRAEPSKYAVRLYRQSVSGRVTQLAAVLPDGYNPHEWAFRCTGPNLVIEKDGTAFLSVTDSNYVTGNFGFATARAGGYARIDNAWVSEASEPSGQKHRVIGSGIVNSRAIVRGAV